MKRLFSAALCFLLVAALLPATARTASADTSGQCGDKLHWSLNASNGIMTITGSGEMWDFQENEAPWNHVRTEIRSVMFSESVANIGTWAFAHCTSLQHIDFPKSVKTIGSYAFRDCTGMITFESGAGLRSIGAQAFYNCPLLSITLPVSLKSVQREAFNSDTLIKVYYKGSRAQRMLVDIDQEDGSNEPLLYANWEYACNEPYVSEWRYVLGNWYYYDDSGDLVVGWEKIDNIWYYFTAGGAMVTGWQKIDGVWYHFTSGGSMQTGWQKIGGSWYYFTAGGAMVTGWRKLSGKWYYFTSGGQMATGWRQLSGNWYHFEPSGTMTLGWRQLGSKWYYLRRASDGKPEGAMVTGTFVINGKPYNFDKNGVWITD